MKKRSAVFLGLLVLALHSVFADYNKSGVADSSEIRRNLVETWFEAPLSAVRMNRPEIRTNSIGQKFQVRLEESEDFFSVFVAPYARMEIDVYSDKGKSTEMQEVYPGDVPGSWVLVRDKKSGAPLRIRYYFASDSDVFVQFSPVNKTGCADFVCYNKIIVELKCVSSLINAHKGQVINYLKATKNKVGLLINFGGSSLKWERLTNLKDSEER